MSKLSEHIKAHAVGRVPPPTSRYVHVKVEAALESGPYASSTRYRVGVELSAIVIAEVANLDRRIDQARRSLLDHVFGEFRSPLMRARLAVANRDFEEADDILQQIEESMLS